MKTRDEICRALRLLASWAAWLVKASLAALSLAGLSATAQPTVNPVRFEYLPDHTVGNVQASMHPGRFLEVTWMGHKLLTLGGELFTRTYRTITTDGTMTSGGVLGCYLVDDSQPEFDIPVRVERISNGLQYTWICDASSRGYRQVNQAVVQSNRVSLTTTLIIATNVPPQVTFHPVLFPGEQSATGQGAPDPALSGTTFQIFGTSGTVTDQTYPSATSTSAWYAGNCQSIATTLAEGPVRITFLSDNPASSAALYALSKWQMAVGVGTRRGLVTHLTLPRPATNSVAMTCQIILELGSLDANRPSGSPVAIDADFVKLVARSVDRNFWFFHPGEHVVGTLLLENRFSPIQRVMGLTSTLRNYSNTVVQQQAVAATVTAGGETKVPFDFGDLPRGAYAVEWQAIANGNLVGYTVLRVGVVPDHQVVDTTNCFGGFSPYGDQVPQTIELMKWTGVGKARFRTSANDEYWNVFEPTQGRYLSKLPSVAIANQFASNGIPLTYCGEQFPPTTLPSWCSSNQVDRFFAYYGGPACFFPTNITLFTDYVQTWASHYTTNVQCFETFNEPYHTMAISNAVRNVQLISTSIKSVSPSAQILSPDMGDNLSAPALLWMAELLAGAHNFIDVVVYHQYAAKREKHNSGVRFPALETTAWEANVRSVAGLAARYGKPAWNGETGWVGGVSELFPNATFTEGEMDTANAEMRGYLLTLGNGVKTLVQCWGIQFQAPSHMYHIYPTRESSLVGWGRMVKPWSVAHATLSELIDTATFAGRVTLSDTNIYLLCFQRSDRMFAAAWDWSTTNNIYLSNPLAGTDATFTSIVGQPLTSGPAIVLSQSPIYISSFSISKDAFIQRLAAARVIPSLFR